MDDALGWLAALSLAAWLYLVFLRGGFWRADQRLDMAPADRADWPAVAAIVPARDEAAVIGRSLAALLAQDYPGAVSVVVVDDHSGDGTAARARAAAAGAGAVCCAFLSRGRSPHFDIGLTLNGALGGLVAITAPCAVVDPWAAIVIGAIAAPVVILGIEGLDRLKIDDPVGAVSVHAFNGVWGVMAVGLFASQDGIAQAYVARDKYGLLLGGGVEQLGIQALGVLAIAGWTVVASGIMFAIIKYTIGLRVSPEEEERGLDLSEHGVEAYPDFQPSPSLGGASVIPSVSQPAPTGAAPGSRRKNVRTRQ